MDRPSEVARSAHNPYAQADDVRLVEGLRSAIDSEWELAWEEFDRRFAPKLISVIARRCPKLSRAEHEELAQDAVERIRLNLPKYKSGSFAGWCLTIARNFATDLRRRMKEELKGRYLDAYDPALILPTSAPTQTHPVMAQRLARLPEALALLTERQSDVLRMFWLEGWSNGEIDAHFGRRSGWAATVKFEAQRRLREIFEAAEKRVS